MRFSSFALANLETFGGGSFAVDGPMYSLRRFVLINTLLGVKVALGTKAARSSDGTFGGVEEIEFIGG
jgi:hypothetical protein